MKLRRDENGIVLMGIYEFLQDYSLLDERQLPWPQFIPNPDTNPRNALTAYGIRSYPELIVIDAKGTIVACPRNVEELSSVLKKLHNSQQ